MATISKDNIILELVARAEKFERTLKDQNKKVTGFQNTVSRAQKAVIGFFAARLSRDLIVNLADAAAGLEQLAVKANTVFGDALPKVTKAAQENAIQLGLTRAEYVASAAAIQDLLVPMGFQRDIAANISIELTNLSGALSEWTGGQRSATEVAEILQKALLGERESLKSLGISITENDVKTRLAEKGLKNLTGTTLQQAKAAATLELITEKSTDAQAAFAAGSETLARRQRELSAVIRDTANNIANELTPVLSDLFNAADPSDLQEKLRFFVAFASATVTAVGTVFKNFASLLGGVIAQAELGVLRFRRFVSSVTGENQAALDRQIDFAKVTVARLNDASQSVFEAASKAFNDSLERQENFLKRSEDQRTALQLDSIKRRNEVLSKEQQKAAEQARKDQEQAQRNIEDLRNALIADAQERAIAEAETKTRRLIEALVGTPDQVEEQTTLLKEALERELLRIQREAFQVLETIRTIDPTEGEDIPPILERFVEQFTDSSVALKTAGDELTDEVVAIGKDLAESFRQLANETETVSPLGRILEDFLDDESQLRLALNETLNETASFFRQLNDQRIQAADEAIAIQKRRVDDLNKEDSRATAEQIQLEEERLSKIQAEREKFIKQQRTLAAAEIAINTAATIPGAIRAIVEGFQGPGGFLTGLLKAGALASTIISTVAAVRGALSGAPGLKEGIERLMGPGTSKSDSIPIFASKNERIVSAEQNAQIGFDFPNKKLPEAVAFYKKYGIPGPSQEAINGPLQVVKTDNSDLLEEMVRMRRAFNAMKVEFNVSKDGIYAAVTRQQQKINHQKKLKG